MKEPKRLAIIPARGGSKRLPRKNIKLLGDAHLICWTIGPAIALFDKVVVSSDSKEILDVVKSIYSYAESLVVDSRPSHLATDTSKVIDTVSYYYDSANLAKENFFDEIWLLLPTCPLRTYEDIREAQLALKSEDVDGVVSVTDPEFPPTLHLTKDTDGLIGGWGGSHPFAEGNSRSQDQPVTYRPNGALYGMKWAAFNRNRNFYKGRVKGYYMPRERSIDIDTSIDFAIAEAMIKNGN